MRQVPADDFEARYRLDDDPWQFATSEYEQRRFEITVASLPAVRFGRVFEPGCAGGELTVRLSQRCDELVACDGSPTVLRRARQRVSEAADPSCRVELDVGVIPEWWPIGEFDLIVNATSVGLGGVKALPLPADVLTAGSCVVDMVYSNTETALLKAARGRGARTVDGLEILVAQGAASLERWTGRSAPRDTMGRAARDTD